MSGLLGAVSKQRGVLAVSEAAEYVLQACEALAEAHEAACGGLRALQDRRLDLAVRDFLAREEAAVLATSLRKRVNSEVATRSRPDR